MMRRNVTIPGNILEKLLGMPARKNSCFIVLYLFYLRKATEQKTNQIWCNNEYAAKELEWNVGTVANAKRQLVKMGVITNIRKQKKGKRGWGRSYINIEFI